LDLEIGPKPIASRLRIQETWLLTKDLRLVGFASGAPKRIIIKIIIFIP